MKNFGIFCVIALMIYITMFMVTSYSMIGTMPINEPFELKIVFQIFIVITIPAILGIFIGFEFKNKQLH